MQNLGNPTPLALAPQSTLAKSVDWSAVPETLWLHNDPAKPGAIVHVTAGGYPAIVTGSYGKGRVGVVLCPPLGEAPDGQTPFWTWTNWAPLMTKLMNYLVNGDATTVDTPNFIPVPGAYNSATAVTITSATSGATIRYTTDGTTPNETSGTVYSSPVTMNATATLKAIAYQNGMSDSGIMAGAYTIGATAATPTFSPGAGSYNSTQTVTISSTTSGAFIRYTLDGTAPSETNGVMYTTPVLLNASCTLQAIAYMAGMTDSAVAGGSYTITTPQTAAPLCTPLPDTYINAVAVTLSSTTSGATIRYTTDGSTPSESAGTVYSSVVNIIATTTLKAIAYLSGYTDSTITSGLYTIQTAAPDFAPEPDEYLTTQTVTLTSATTGATIRYTTDGSTPSETNGTIYSSPVALNSDALLQAVAYNSGMTDSTVTGGDYLIDQVDAPAFSPVPDQYSSAQSVAITTATGGATIRYTTDGTTPTETAGTVYSSAVTIGTTTRLQAIAYESGFIDSYITAGTYTIGQTAAPTFTPAPGTYNGTQLVTIACATHGATLRYTTDGSTPSETAGTLYVVPLALSSTTTLKAMAYYSGITDSAVTSGVYTIGSGGTIVWVDDALPAGAIGTDDGGDSWNWISSNPTPYSGSLAWQSNNTSGEHQVYFTDATTTLTPGANDTLFCYVYLSTSSTPAEVMLQFHDTTGSWEHRAYWGANDITWGTDGTVSRQNVGSLPPAGQWVCLSVTASTVGVQGLTIDGGAYTLYNGQATFDYAGLIPAGQQCATPTYSPPAGTYEPAQSVSISTTTGSATIRYTTDGTTPSETVGTVYSSPVNISSTCTLKAIAYKSGLSDSTITSGVYTICAATYTTDTTTEGSWWSSVGDYVYGSQGYLLCDWNNGTDVSSLSGSYVQSVSPSSQIIYYWNTSTDPRATINPATGTRAAACWYSASTFYCTVTFGEPERQPCA